MINSRSSGPKNESLRLLFYLTEVTVPQELFQQILQRIRRLDPMPDTG
jgi:hypothetical protein